MHALHSYSLCPEISKLTKLKSLSLEYNAINVNDARTKWTDDNPQPLPKGLFESTQLIDLNLKGNQMTNSQLVSLKGRVLYSSTILCVLSIVYAMYQMMTCILYLNLLTMVMNMFNLSSISLC